MHAFNALIIDAGPLAEALSSDISSLVLLDIRPIEERESGYIPFSQHLAPERINRTQKPMNGLLPTAEEVQKWAKEFGITPTSSVVVYDGGKTTAAARALWVLNAYGYTRVHWLNGGLPIWRQSGHQVDTGTAPESTTGIAPEALPDALSQPKEASTTNSSMPLVADPSVVVSKETLLKQFTQATTSDPAPQAIDARSAAEFAGTDVRSERGGHMPGAVHFEWLDLFQDDGRLKPDVQLREALDQRSIRADQPCVVYCQSHQRSAVTYLVLKHLGFTDVAALDGAWSNWGNDPDTPIET